VLDCHVHTVHSGDSPAPLLDMCVRAVEVGITKIVFTEHLDFTPTDYSYGAFVYESWIREIESAREEFGGRLIIHRGVEVDYQERFRRKIEDYLGCHDFDYVLGSAHYVDGIIMEDHEAYFPGKSAREAYLPYFDALRATVESGLFRTLGHIDLCKRHGARYFGPFRLDEFEDEMTGVLKTVVERGMMIEINTSGLRQAPAETYPTLDTLKLYHGLGGRNVAVGSDSHKPEHLGFGLETGYALAREASLFPIETL
jgi:histidinol-phosphatase (PHP family)